MSEGWAWLRRLAKSSAGDDAARKERRSIFMRVNLTFRLRLLLKILIVLFVLPVCVVAQDDEDWPPLSYLRSDYKAVAVVAHIRIKEAEITNRIIGYENWRIRAEVIEPFKGKFKKGDAIEYVHGAEAGFKKEYFTGEKIVFLLPQREKGRRYYAVLENSTLPYTEARVKKLRLIRGRRR
jgi:hypothetical protein